MDGCVNGWLGAYMSRQINMFWMAEELDKP